MRRGSKLPNRKVYIATEDDEERIRKTESKKAIIRAEFEKHKKELRVNIADPSKINEIRLKNQLEELLTANEKREKDLKRLENFGENLERENLEATQFFETMTKFNVSKANETFLSAGFHPNRTTSRMDGLRNTHSAEVLSEKKTELMETLKNIELLIEQEDEAEALVQERFEELRKNQVLVSKKVNELKRMNDHAEIRFTDLKKIEFLALTKQATTESNLKEMRDEIKELKNQETTYKVKKEHEKKRELEYLNAKQNEMSNILIELDKKRIEHQQKQEEVRKLELQYEDVRDKRQNTKIVTKYIEALNALHKGKQGNLIVAHQALKELSERLDNSRDNSPYRTPQDRGTPFNFDDTPRRRGSRVFTDNNDEMLVKRDSILDRKYYIEKIRRFYDENPDGPEPVADHLIQQYLDQCYQEESYKTLYEEQQAQKRDKESLLQSLEDELRLIKGKNEYITLGRSGSKILESNEQEAIDSGMVVINSTTTTLNQAKFEFEHKKDSDYHLNLFAQTEAFVMRCYLDSIEMITRFSKVLASIYNQAGGYISEDLREVSKSINTQIQQFRRGKKSNNKQQELSTSQTMSDAPPEVYRTHTDNSTGSTSEREKEQDSLSLVLDLQEIYELFISIFEGCNEEAAEFVNHVRNDIIIASFITIDDIKNYIQNCQSGIYVDMHIQKAFRDIAALRKIAIENMLQKFEIIYKLYMDLVAASEQAAKELSKYLGDKGVNVQVDIMSRRKSDQNVFVKKAVQKKWQNLMDRYDYDPGRDYRKYIKSPDEEDQNISTYKKQQAKDNNTHEKETYDREDVKAKLNELGGNKSKKLTDDPKKSFFRGNEEEKKRFQAKKLHEKQKQAIENMTDDDYLNFQRKQIKTVKEDYVFDFNENQLLMKAQADLAQRLSQAEPLEELKKMIENSKFISKLQILEKQKSVIDGKRALKQEIVEKYIPPEPVRVPKSALSKVSKEYKIKTTRSTLYTPINDSTGNNRFFALATERRRTETDYSDSVKELSVRAATTKSTSRFKPQESPFELVSSRTLDSDRERSQPKFKSNTLKNLKQWPIHTEDDDDKLSGRSGYGVQTERGLKASIEKKVVVEKGNQTARDKRLAKSKSGKIDLPKLEKITKKKTKLYKKKRNHSEEANPSENENVNQFMNLQTDPLLKMVYSPNFFASSDIRSVTLGDDLDYKFDAYRFKAPGLLVSEQM